MYRHISPEVFTGKGNKTVLLECDGTLANRESQMIQRNLLPQNAEMRTEVASSLQMLIIINKNSNPVSQTTVIYGQFGSYMDNVQLYHEHVPWMDNEGRKKVNEDKMHWEEEKKN